MKIGGFQAIVDNVDNVENFQKYASKIREKRLFQWCNYSQRYPQKNKKYPQIFRPITGRKIVDIVDNYF